MMMTMIYAISKLTLNQYKNVRMDIWYKIGLMGYDPQEIAALLESLNLLLAQLQSPDPLSGLLRASCVWDVWDSHQGAHLGTY